MINHITAMGRLTHDPELRHTASGVAVCSFAIACERDYKDGNGDKQVDYIDVVAWRNTAEFVAKYLTKGRMAVVDGRLQLRDWTDREGTKRRNAEILAASVNFGDSKPKDAAPTSQRAAARAGTEADDELPF